MQRSALCRSRRELSNEYLLAKIGVDTAENEPLEVWGENSIQYSLHSLVARVVRKSLAARENARVDFYACPRLVCTCGAKCECISQAHFDHFLMCFPQQNRNNCNVLQVTEGGVVVHRGWNQERG